MPSALGQLLRLAVPILSQFGWIIMFFGASRFGQRFVRRLWRWFWA
jgi:hypothetical protein